LKRRGLPGIVAAVAALLLAVWFLFPGLALTVFERLELAAAGLEEKSVEVAGHRVAYLEGGSGEPLVLLHGFGAEKNNWVRIARHLTPHFRVVAPDLPGFGDSTRDPNARYAVSDQVVRVRALVEALDLGGVHLGGNSMGGMIAGAYAARFPDGVKSLWLVAPGGVAGARKSELARLLERGENPLLVDTPEGFDRLLAFCFVEVPYVPGPIRRHLTERAIETRPFSQKILQDLQSEPGSLEDAVRGLPVPTLITWGDRDRLVDVSGAEVLRSVLPNAEVAIVPNTGHIPMLERPEEAARGYLRFRGLEPAA
jgi:pimeloyl-ACP methyl ester carboxylesterase